MPLFHPKIIDKAIKNTEAIPPVHLAILSTWAKNLTRGIFDRETSHDGEFIQRILIDVLGYVGSSGELQYTIAKNQPVGSGNVDVALGHFSETKTNIIAPFELKGAKTRDLDAIMPGRNKSPVQQAWEYGMDAKGARWVLVSNYREIRLYAIGYGRKDYERFDLAQLTIPANYARFILLLSAESLLGHRTQALLEESENKDKEVTDKLYKDYKMIRSQMIDTLRQDNPELPLLSIVQHTQTILDRILFVAFAEDKGLLPNNTLKSCFEDKARWNPQPAWENFKGLFHAIDKGNALLNIPGYNGGLFSENVEINQLSVSDSLCENFKTLGAYDFDSEVSVNILGHIFEQSITDLEAIKAELTSGVIVKRKKDGKRSKDGIFYTPPYITRYIVEQAVGGWLKDRRDEIGFSQLVQLKDSDYASISTIQRGPRKGKLTYNKNVEQHLIAWEAYKDVLTNIKILDPACGSGAFLNEVFDFLLREGQAINSELTTLNGGQTMLFRWDKHILSNNIFGVDINQESVEITKLSLWLKTANRNEKLTYLDDNIKSGNSLIDDPSVAGQLAFNWENQFEAVMEAGGFDIIVGNPPYVFAREKISTPEKDYYVSKYTSAQYQVNTYLLFIEKSLRLIRAATGRMSLIVPNAWLMVSSAEKLRKLVVSTTTIKSITNLIGHSFENVNVETMIIDLLKSPAEVNHHIAVYQNNNDNNFYNLHEREQSSFAKNKGSEFQVFLKTVDTDLIDKIKKDTVPLDSVADVKAGLQAYEIGKGIPKQTAQDVKNRIYDYTYKFDQHTHKYLEGKDVQRYLHTWTGNYLRYGSNLASPRTFNLFSDNVLILREITGKYPKSLITSFSPKGEVFLFNRSNIAILQRAGSEYDLRYLLALLNSSVLAYYFMRITPKAVRKMFPKVILQDLKSFPIKEASPSTQQALVEKVELILNAKKGLEALSMSFVSLLKAELNLQKTSNVLNQWFLLDFKDFLDELKKLGVVLSLSDKSEWMKHFIDQKNKAEAICNEVNSLDKEIDLKVYELYNLNNEEREQIKLVSFE